MPSNLLKRTIFGLLFVVTVGLGIIYYEPTFCVVFLLLLIIGLNEFYKMMRLRGISPLLWQGIVVGVTVFGAGLLHNFYQNSFLYLIVIVEVFLVGISETFRGTKTPMQNIATLLGAVAYIAVPLTLLQYIFHQQGTPFLVLSMFFIIWICDSGAYLVGSLFGRTKLCPNISPKKTWEGLLGGFAFSLILALFLPYKYLPITIWERIVFAIIVVTFSAFGDLFQSMLKRSVGVKDSGDILPGHGGILDRIDSMLFTIPAIFVYLELTKYL